MAPPSAPKGGEHEPIPHVIPDGEREPSRSENHVSRRMGFAPDVGVHGSRLSRFRARRDDGPIIPHRNAPITIARDFALPLNALFRIPGLIRIPALPISTPLDKEAGVSSTSRRTRCIVRLDRRRNGG